MRMDRWIDIHMDGWINTPQSAVGHLPVIKYLLEEGGSDVTEDFSL